MAHCPINVLVEPAKLFFLCRVRHRPTTAVALPPHPAPVVMAGRAAALRASPIAHPVTFSLSSGFVPSAAGRLCGQRRHRFVPGRRVGRRRRFRAVRRTQHRGRASLPAGHIRRLRIPSGHPSHPPPAPSNPAAAPQAFPMGGRSRHRNQHPKNGQRHRRQGKAAVRRLAFTARSTAPPKW